MPAKAMDFELYETDGRPVQLSKDAEASFLRLLTVLCENRLQHNVEESSLPEPPAKGMASDGVD